MGSYLYIDIADIRFSRKKRRGVSQKRVSELIAEIDSGHDIFPIRVNALGDGTYVIRDGRHRLQAHIEAGISHIYACVDNLVSRLLGFIFNLKSPHMRRFLLSDILIKKPR